MRTARMFQRLVGHTTAAVQLGKEKFARGTFEKKINRTSMTDLVPPAVIRLTLN